MPNIKVNEERKMACISTAHMKREDAALLDNGVTPMGLTATYEYGYQFWDADEEYWPDWQEKGFSRDFFDNLKLVFALGYDRVEVDRDAAQADGLQVFDW